MRRYKAATVAAAVLAMVASPAVASAGGGYGDPVRTIAEGLSGPRELDTFVHGKLVVVESDTGEVSSVDPRTGAVRTLLSDLPGPQGLEYDSGKLYVALGEAPPDDPGPDAAARGGYEPEVKGSSVIVATPGGKLLKSYDLLAHELKYNPDRQPHEDEDGVPYPDAVSNPFAVHVHHGRILVADAGANAVLSIDQRTGKIRTFFVPPLVRPKEVPACAEVPNQPGFVGCDSVPTGVTVGKDGLVYVSTLGSEVEGAARVYVLNQKGKVLRVIRGLTGVTGVAVDGWGNVYASELFTGAPQMEATEEEPPRPSEEELAGIGQIVKITKGGARSYAQVTMPTGLLFADGKLWSSAWSVAIFFELADRGEVVTVAPRAFERFNP